MRAGRFGYSPGCACTANALDRRATVATASRRQTRNCIVSDLPNRRRFPVGFFILLRALSLPRLPYKPPGTPRLALARADVGRQTDQEFGSLVEPLDFDGAAQLAGGAADHLEPERLALADIETLRQAAA